MNTGELADLYLRHDLEKLEEAAKFYDYIELLPKSTYNELIEKDGTGALGSYEEVEKMNKYLGTEYLRNWLNELEKTETKEIKEKFAYTATQYMLSKILSDKVTDEKSKEELLAKANEKYNEAKQWFEELLKSGSDLM